MSTTVNLAGLFGTQAVVVNCPTGINTFFLRNATAGGYADSVVGGVVCANTN